MMMLPHKWASLVSGVPGIAPQVEQESHCGDHGAASGMGIGEGIT